ncbi:hypothetical protein DL240_12525 [Lujinxingia litoralis]|uniref:DUF4157 domain-containing protein n=1 Tax=Lujinxingia litoralis TaxID=2211119 RepID=A0A328C3R6_9DELT|nr:hypothetical protein [Lujinxingia litoralis]RAL21674.1 hypothetical protein DL240_12525 [Lujinxingia litoralis]
MKSRTLLADELPLVVNALCAAEVGPPEMVKRAADIARIIAYPTARAAISGPRALVAHVALRRSASGITLREQIFVRETVVDAELRLPLYLLIHEMAHVVQFLRDGTTNFLARYLAEYSRGLLAGMGDHQAYLNISYEVEARLAETYLPPHLRRGPLMG